jgi:hypothetical protein
MVNGDETAESYRTSAEILRSKKGDKPKIISYLFKAAKLYSPKNRKRAIECLDELHNNLKGSTTEFGMDQYFRYLHQLAKAYEDLEVTVTSADVYVELAKDIYKHKAQLLLEKTFSGIEILKKFSAYLAKALMLYDAAENYEPILRIARTYYKDFPVLQQNESLHNELYFCYEHIIHAADITGSRYFREYYAGLDQKLRGIQLAYEGEEGDESKGPYTAQ